MLLIVVNPYEWPPNGKGAPGNSTVAESAGVNLLQVPALISTVVPSIPDDPATIAVGKMLLFAVNGDTRIEPQHSPTVSRTAGKSG